jgi:hypothetical protein
MPLAMDELQRLIDTEPKANDMITEYVSSIIGDLTILSECLRQLDSYQPWASTFENLMIDKEKGIAEQYAKTSQPWAGMYAALKESVGGPMVQLGKPAEKRFDYPVWKRRNKENTEIMRRAEANLDAFWSYIDKRMSEKVSNLTGSAVGSLLAQSRILQRTPEWSEPGTSDIKFSDSNATSLELPLSELYFELESRT